MFNRLKPVPSGFAEVRDKTHAEEFRTSFPWCGICDLERDQRMIAL